MKEEVQVYRFKFAAESAEFEQIARLNYRVFVEETPRFAANPERRLVDPHHDENVYAICLHEREVVGVAALRSQPPGFLAAGSDDLDAQLPPHRSICDLRLLAIAPKHRSAEVARRLIEMAAEYCLAREQDLIVTAAPQDDVDLHRQLGFTAFGAAYAEGDVMLQPMALTVEAACADAPWAELPQSPEPVSFMPGPVSLPAAVRAALCAEPVSHRAAQFVEDVAQLKRTLCERANARYVELFFGSATLANEALAAQLTLLPGRGVMLSNGEFGSRLVEQARCWQLDIETYESEWGESFDYAALEERFARDGDIGWLWFTHCETSTGMLNDLDRLKELCARYDVRCCVDCISSIGAVPIDLSGVYLATGASGKALGSFAGLGMVFYNEPVAPSPQVPRYLDIGYYAARNGVPFTLMSNLVYALAAALEIFDADYYAGVARLARQVRSALRNMGLNLIAADVSIPTVTTIALPQQVNSVALGDALLEAGYELSYKSRYLVERNWIQICLMGEHAPQTVRAMLAAFRAQVEHLAAGESAG